MKTLSLISIILLLNPLGGFSGHFGLSPLPVTVGAFRNYNPSSGPDAKPGQKLNTLSIRLNFNKPNQEPVISQTIPQLFVQQLNNEQEWESGRIPADIYQDEDKEWIVTIARYNLERYFSNIMGEDTWEKVGGPRWSMEDYQKEICRLEERRYWKLRLICDYQFEEKDFLTNDKGWSRAKIHPDEFIANDAVRGEIELKFHIGSVDDLIEFVNLPEMKKIYLENKNNSRERLQIKDVRLTKSGKYFIAAMNAGVLVPFFKGIKGKNVTWNKAVYQEMFMSLQQDWNLYVIGEPKKRYDLYDFKDYSIDNCQSSN